MSLAEDKKKVIESFGIHSTDTGSHYVQVAIITERIRNLTEHMKTHGKDFSTKRGLLKLIAQRRCYLKYVAKKDEQGYKELVKRLGLRK